MFHDFFKSLENQYDERLPFVAYRKPNEDFVTAVFQKNDFLNSVKNFKERGFVFAPFDANDAPILLSPDNVFHSTYLFEERYAHDSRKSMKMDEVGKEFHIELVKKGISEIKKGSFEKVVLSRTLQVPCEKSPVVWFHNLLNTYPNAFCYLWHHPKVGTWLGATPEILLLARGGKLTTVSLAGTRRNANDTPPNWGDKELEEQAVVTRFIFKRLKKRIHDLEISETESVRAGKLWHLRTVLNGSYEKSDLPNIIRELHPTPAVCGMPREPAKSFILKNENYYREYYTGFLGELNFGEEHTSCLYVNLRCMQLKQKKVILYMGGGITRDSIPEQEWQETVDKSATMLNVLFKLSE